ncbi:hypothetical protein [Calothrix sp. CCY 0018]|uniref:hypothetical protein n=1 Tax=Calothrix sp. CCY 0018 TaxID=3103864 RepID=UPI0039C622DF
MKFKSIISIAFVLGCITFSQAVQVTKTVAESSKNAESTLVKNQGSTTARKLTFSRRNLKQGINRLPINSREWVEMKVKGDYVTEMILKTQNGSSSKLRIKQDNLGGSNTTGEGSWYFKSNGCMCWEDEEGQQSVCTEECFN